MRSVSCMPADNFTDDDPFIFRSRDMSYWLHTWHRYSWDATYWYPYLFFWTNFLENFSQLGHFFRLKETSFRVLLLSVKSFFSGIALRSFLISQDPIDEIPDLGVEYNIVAWDLRIVNFNIKSGRVFGGSRSLKACLLVDLNLDL